jgi:GGDEF domain-containing protein
VALIADAPAPTPSAARALSLLRESTASQIGYTTAALLAIGLLISIATTPDPLWWHLHFSRLGTFAVFSGYMFNATIILTGVGVVVFRRPIEYADLFKIADERLYRAKELGRDRVESRRLIPDAGTATGSIH